MTLVSTPRQDLTASPCIGTCSTVSGDEICQGCLRTFDEVVQWQSLPESQKVLINQRILLEKSLNN